MKNPKLELFISVVISLAIILIVLFGLCAIGNIVEDGDMIKGKGTLTFKFYTGADAQHYHVNAPKLAQPGEDVHEDKQEELDINMSEEKEEDVQEEPTKDPLVLTGLGDGLHTGSKIMINFECSKDQMRSLLDAESQGLAPTFTFKIQ